MEICTVVGSIAFASAILHAPWAQGLFARNPSSVWIVTKPGPQCMLRRLGVKEWMHHCGYMVLFFLFFSRGRHLLACFQTREFYPIAQLAWLPLCHQAAFELITIFLTQPLNALITSVNHNTQLINYRCSPGWLTSMLQHRVLCITSQPVWLIKNGKVKAGRIVICQFLEGDRQ